MSAVTLRDIEDCLDDAIDFFESECVAVHVKSPIILIKL